MRYNNIKIKFNIGKGEIKNCIASIIIFLPLTMKYMIFFNDGISYDLNCKFDSKRKVFYGIG